MPPTDDSSAEPAAAAINAAIEHNADVVKRGRREKGFLKRLGLSLPVTVADVKQAYFQKARETHPDRHGQASDFIEVQKAFDEALEYAKRNGKRLKWVGSQLPIYVAQQQVAERVQQAGGSVKLEQLDWLEDTVGEDFAQVADRLVEINLAGSTINDAQLAELSGDRDGFMFVETIRLTDVPVTDVSVEGFLAAERLAHIDLRGTKVSSALKKRFSKLPRRPEVEGLSGWAGFFGLG